MEPRPTVLVTGASTGIGRATALRLEREGFHVVAAVRRDVDAESLRDAAGAELETVLLDITDDAQRTAVAERLEESLGQRGLAGLVNNAGVAVAGPLEFLPIDQLRDQLEVNLVGHVATTQAMLPLLRRARGRIVFMGSMGGRFSQPYVGPYCASKFALEAVNDAFRMELRPWGIEVAIVEPGAVATPIWERSSKRAEALVQRVPPRALELYGDAITAMRRVAASEYEHGIDPDQVAGAVLHALTARRPRTRYPVGLQANVAVRLARVLPDRWKDALVMQQIGLRR